MPDPVRGTYLMGLLNRPCQWAPQCGTLQDMKVTQKVQLEPEDLEFIDRVCESFHYGSKSEYMRAAIREKIRADKRKLRQLQRQEAMKDYSEGHEDIFEPLAGEPFEDR